MSPSIEPLPVQKLDSLLSQSLGNDFQINHLEWRPLTAAGENYGSVMLAITVTVTRSNKTETLNLVAKLPPTSAYFLELFNSPVTFNKELHFYSSMAREFVKLQLESGINEEDLSILVPKYFGGRLGLKSPTEFDEQAAIVLENLKCNGYDTEDRIFGLDEKHTEFAVQELAKLHALAVAFKIKKPKVYEKIAAMVLQSVSSETTEECVMEIFKKSLVELQNIDEVKPLLDRINRTVEHGLETAKDPKEPEEPWGTLLHNDFWVNNMMFQHDHRGELIGMKIVDFQLCAYDYGAKDLVFFLISSANREILDNKLDDMIDLYYSAFVKMLQTLKVDTERFSKRKFDEIVDHCGPLKFNQCIMMAQVIQAPKRNEPKTKSNDAFLNVTGNDIYRQKLLHITRIFDKKGWLLK